MSACKPNEHAHGRHQLRSTMVGSSHPGRLGAVDEVVLSGGVNGAERAVWAPRALGRKVVVGENVSVGPRLPQLLCVDVRTQGVGCALLFPPPNAATSSFPPFLPSHPPLACSHGRFA